MAFPAPFDRAEFVGGLDLVWGTVFPRLLVNGMFRVEVSEGGFGDRRGRDRDFFRHGRVAIVAGSCSSSRSSGSWS